MMPWLLQLMLTVAVLPLVSASSLRAQGATDSDLYVVNYIDAAPATKDRVATLLRRLADASRKEPNVMRFEVLQRTAPSNQFVVLEVWKDQDGLDKHIASAHYKQFSSELTPLLIAPVDDRLCVATSVAPLPPMHDAAAVLVVTHVDVGPPNREKAAVALKALAESSRKDSGNLRFDIVHQKARTNHFTVIAAWKDQEAGGAHELATHTKDFRATLAPLTGALYDQRWYKRFNCYTPLLPSRSIQISANNRAGPPVASLILAKPTTKVAPTAGTLSRLATFSSPQRPLGSQSR